VLLVSGAIGFRAGAGAFADWQVAVETAQVVAGLVDYPAGNPFYIYHTKLWTILHQWLAVMLLAGVSERTLSIAVSGLLGMVSFQALSLIVYALSRDLLLAVGASSVIFLSRVAEAGGVYPIWLLGTTHTYGVLALSYAALVPAFVGAGWIRTGLFLLGMAPALHPSLGAWVMAIAALAFVWDVRRLSQDFRPALPAFLAGCAVTAASLIVQLTFIYDVPRVDGSVSDTYLAAFVMFWDSHRQPVNLQGDTVRLNIAALVIGVLWLTRFRERLPRPSLSLLRFVVVSAALSLALALISWIPPDRLPPALLIAMPGRVLNLNMLMFGAVLLGVVGAYRRAWWASALTLLLTVALLLGGRSGLWLFEGGHQAFVRRIPDIVRMNSTNILLRVAVLHLAIAAVSGWIRKSRRQETGDWNAMRHVGRACRAASLLVVFWAAIVTWTLDAPRGLAMLDRTNDVLFQIVSQGEGLLLTGGDLHLIQLRTRRPVLLDGGGLDALPYATEAAPEMERILRDVYSIELLDPPEEARHLGAVPHEFVKNAWESYPLERWQQIANTYGARQVVTSGDWDLKLPVAVRNRTLTVYDIPHASP
jgi:hypothetical protein